MSAKKSDRSIEELLGSLPDGGRVVPFFVSAHDRQAMSDDTDITKTAGIYVGKAHLLERVSTPYTNKMNSDFNVQRWSILIIKLSPISDRACDNTSGLKNFQVVERWIAEYDLPKVLLYDAKQKDLFADINVDDPTETPKATESKTSKPTRGRPKGPAKTKATSGDVTSRATGNA